MESFRVRFPRENHPFDIESSEPLEVIEEPQSTLIIVTSGEKEESQVSLRALVPNVVKDSGY
jgi:hypothetical protein